MSARQLLDVQAWELVLGKMHRYHANVSQEVAIIVQTIRKEMKSELVPMAEERANFGKTIKLAVREMWALEYEIEEIQTEFAKSIGSIDIKNLTDDFVEDIMLQSKPLQGILHAIRQRQKSKMEDIKKRYWDQIQDLEPMKVDRPPKPAPKPEPKAEEKKEGEKKEEAAKPAAENAPENAAAAVTAPVGQVSA